MKKTLLETCAMALCFVTVACFMIVLSFAVWNVIAFTFPSLTLNSYEWERHQSDEAFKESLIHMYGPQEFGPKNNTYMPPEGAALTKERERSYAASIGVESRSSLHALVQYLIMLLINAFVFIVPWKILARTRQSDG